MKNLILTVDELAQFLRVQPDTIRSWARKGLIPSLRPNPRILRFEVRAVVKALRKITKDGKRSAKGAKNVTTRT